MNKGTLIKAGALVSALVLIVVLLGRNNTVNPQDNIVDSPAVPLVSSAETPKVQKLKLKEVTVDWQRTILIEGAITDNNVGPVVEFLVQLEQTSEPIYVIINSPGGSVLAGEKIISAMESAKGPVFTICDGLCASMASLILEYGSQRYATNRSIVMLHDAAMRAEGNLARMNREIALMQRKVDKADEYICYRSKIDCKQFRAEKLNEIWLDSEDAYAKGLLDGIIKSINNPLVKPLAITQQDESFDLSFIKKLGDSIKSAH